MNWRALNRFRIDLFSFFWWGKRCGRWLGKSEEGTAEVYLLCVA